MQRITTGNPEADLVLGGGFPVNSINILMGEPGTGKTVFAEQLLFANAGGDRPVLYLTTLSEPLSKVVTYLQRFPFFDERKLGTSVIYEDIGGLLATQGIAALVPRLREAITSIQPKIIVIDSFKAIHDLAVGPGGPADDLRHGRPAERVRHHHVPGRRVPRGGHVASIPSSRSRTGSWSSPGASIPRGTSGSSG